MVSNINLLTKISLGALVLWTITAVPVTFATKSSVFVYYDLISFLLVCVAPGLLLFAGLNNINYNNQLYLKIRTHFLIEVFIICGMLATLMGLLFIVFISYHGVEHISGEGWVIVGRSLAVALLTDYYAYCLAIACYFLKKIYFNNSDSSKVLEPQKSNILISIICFCLFISILSIAFTFAGLDTGISIFKVVSLPTATLGLIILILFIIVLGKNLSIIKNSFMNKKQEIYLLENALLSIRNSTKIIAGFCVLIILATFINIGVHFGDLAQYGGVLLGFMSFGIIIAFLLIVIAKTFELRILADMISQNHYNIKMDKYFLFKFIFPIYLVYFIISNAIFTFSFWM